MGTDNKAIASRFVQAWNPGNLAVVDELAAPGLTVSYPVLPHVVRGPEAFKALLTYVHTAMPDVRFTVEDVIGDGDRVAVRWRGQGTHLGELFGIGATGKSVTWTGITLYRLADGNVVEELGEEDALGMMQQLGVIPAPSPSAAG